MRHEVLKLVAAQSTATIGSVTRTWLRVTGILWLSVGCLIAFGGAQPHGEREVAAIFAGLLIAAVLSVPVMGVLAIVHVARKW